MQLLWEAAKSQRGVGGVALQDVHDACGAVGLWTKQATSLQTMHALVGDVPYMSGKMALPLGQPFAKLPWV